jgi:hypothetical protein
MPAVQTSYAQTILPAVEGMIANSEPHNIISRQIESAAGIGFGKVCVQGTADEQIRVSEATRKFRGITVMSHNAGKGIADAYDQYETVPVLERGPIWVLVSVAVAVGDQAYYVPATGVITNVSTSNTAIPDGTFDSSTTGSGLAILRIG